MNKEGREISVAVNGKGLGEEISDVLKRGDIREVKRCWETRSRSQLKRMPMDFDFFCLTEEDEMPMAHSLSQKIGEGGWG